MVQTYTLINTADVEPEPGYWAALGLFIHQFSASERLLQMLLHWLSGTKVEVAKAVFSGARSDTCRDFINRICDATGRQANKARLAVPFAQLGHITAARNAIVHWGSTVLPDNTVAAINDFLAHTPEKKKSIPISVEILDRMTFDLKRINGLIGQEVLTFMPQTDKIRKVAEENADALSRSSKFLLDRGVDGLWLYKPPQPPLPEKGTCAPRRERQPPPDASQT